uniref:MFAP1 domain-containing protein n=1 Tax=Globodera pallida TaxID=36090 RepID=A0A183CCE7_GLOPA
MAEWKQNYANEILAWKEAALKEKRKEEMLEWRRKLKEAEEGGSDDDREVDEKQRIQQMLLDDSTHLLEKRERSSDDDDRDVDEDEEKSIQRIFLAISTYLKPMVFPDEDNGDDVGIKTRSGKKLSVCQSSEIQSTSNATSLQAICTLKTWKRSTLCFNECTQNRCDPLAKFFRYNRTRTCRRCVIVRKLLLTELILIYDKDELENTLMNYLYFHAIKVFDSDAEQHYANGRAHHPYFVGYSQFREFKSLLVRNIVSCFNLPVAMQSAALRPFIFRSNLWSKAEIDEIGRKVLCDLCTEEDASGERRELDHKFWWPRVLVTLGGKRYLRRGFQFVHNETDISEKNRTFCCDLARR